MQILKPLQRFRHNTVGPRQARARFLARPWRSSGQRGIQQRPRRVADGLQMDGCTFTGA
jgi:hypothetical protein